MYAKDAGDVHFRLLHFGCEVLEEGLLPVDVRDAVHLLETISELTIDRCELSFLFIFSCCRHLLVFLRITEALSLFSFLFLASILLCCSSSYCVEGWRFSCVRYELDDRNAETCCLCQ